MSILSKLFGKKDKNDGQSEEIGKYLPDINIPIDEKFTINFKKNGGKFIYCEDFDEVKHGVQNIISENDWQGKYFCTFDTKLPKIFETANLNFSKKVSDSEIFFTTCENLVARDGSILVCSHQIMDYKIGELPHNLIVYATTSQMVGVIGDALKNIKQKYGSAIPDNITTLKNFLPNDDQRTDFMSYGITSKNVYLLLLEDF